MRMGFSMRALIVAIAVYSGTQVTACAAPQAQCSRAPAGWLEYAEDAAEHRIIVAASVRRDGTISWHGSRISEDQLITYLSRATNFDPAPYFILQHERGLSCDRLRHFRGIFETYADCGRNGICSERERP